MERAEVISRLVSIRAELLGRGVPFEEVDAAICRVCERLQIDPAELRLRPS